MPPPSNTGEPCDLCPASLVGPGLPSALRRIQTTVPTTTSTTPAAVNSAYLTVAPGFGSTDRIRSPSPSASAKPRRNVTVHAARANVIVRRPGYWSAAKNSSAAINDGLMLSGSAITTTATAKLSTTQSNQASACPRRLGRVIRRTSADHGQSYVSVSASPAKLGTVGSCRQVSSSDRSSLAFRPVGGLPRCPNLTAMCCRE